MHATTHMQGFDFEFYFKPVGNAVLPWLAEEQRHLPWQRSKDTTYLHIYIHTKIKYNRTHTLTHVQPTVILHVTTRMQLSPMPAL